MLYNNTIFDLNDIFGIENPNGNAPGDDVSLGDDNLCLVCMSAVKDTVVLPCRHLCLCRKDAQIIRMQMNKCPICRTPVQSYLQIKVQNAKQDDKEPLSAFDE